MRSVACLPPEESDALKTAIKKAGVLIEALPYIQSFHNKIVVVKFGGSAMDVGGDLSNLLTSLVFMSQVGMRPVLVHGGGPMISAEMKRRGKEPVFVKGRRVTDEETLEIAESVLIEKVNRLLVESIWKLGGRSVGMHVRQHGCLYAEKLFLTDEDGVTFDLGFVGRVANIDADRVHSFCDAGIVPVIAPLGKDDAGNTLNVNADTAASVVAAQLGAEKIVFVADVHGIMADRSDRASLLSSVNEEQIADLIARGVISGGMQPKVEACLEAIRAGVKKAHIIDGNIPHSLLLEIFTDKGIGTEIVQ
ncbi:MAG: acetylglutamate kinase [Planctomycetes bacterium]|nr:acetylglutamate kinase [Planctomycetota bacterium]